MPRANKNYLEEVQGIISKMTMQTFNVLVLPECGVRWKDISQAIRNSRLPLTTASVGRILKKHIARNWPAEDIEEFLARLRLKLAATQPRTWHGVQLQEQYQELSARVLSRVLAGNIVQALKNTKNVLRPEVQAVSIGSLIYVSVQLKSINKASNTLFCAVVPGQTVMFVSTLAAHSLIRACVEAIGYKRYQDAHLYGRDIMSLLRVYDRNLNENVNHLNMVPEYAPVPVQTEDGIDLTCQKYDEKYIDMLLGPDPPLLTNLNFDIVMPFFDPSKLNKKFRLSVTLKCDDIAKTLKAFVLHKTIAANSKFFNVFQNMNKNKLYLDDNNDNNYDSD